MNRATETKLERIVEALSQACAPDGKALRAVLADLINFKPEDEPRPLPGYGITKAEMRKVPFFCETYLYGLLGKEDARTLLSRVHRVCEACGIDIERLYEEEKL